MYVHVCSFVVRVNLLAGCNVPCSTQLKQGDSEICLKAETKIYIMLTIYQFILWLVFLVGSS